MATCKSCHAASTNTSTNCTAAAAACCSVLLWHRSDNLAFALVLGGSLGPGEGVECKIKGVLQVSREQAEQSNVLPACKHFSV